MGNTSGYTSVPSSDEEAAVAETEDIRVETERTFSNKMENENNKLNDEIDIWVALAKEEMCTRIDHQKIKIEDLTQRLSKEMGTKVASDESSVENVSIKNRPMNVADEYHLLCSNGWLEAKTRLDDFASDTDNPSVKLQKLTLLCDIFKVSEIVSSNCYKLWMNKLTILMLNPMALSNPDSVHVKDVTPLDAAVCNTLGDNLRNKVEDIGCTEAVKDVLNSLDSKYSTCPGGLQSLWNQSKGTDQIRHFVEQVVKLAWKMVLQRPPMRFDFRNEWLGERSQDMYWDSDSHTSLPMYVVYPMLWHDKALMAKGKVIFVPEDRLSGQIQSDEKGEEACTEGKVEGKDDSEDSP